MWSIVYCTMVHQYIGMYLVGFTLYSECPSVCVCPSTFVTSFSFSVCLPYMMFQTIKTIYFWKLIIWWWQWPRRRLTKRQIQRQRHTDKDKYKVLPRPNVCYFFQKQGVQGFKILYWLSSCDDKDKDKDKVLPRPNVCYFFFKSRGSKD